MSGVWERPAAASGLACGVNSVSSIATARLRAAIPFAFDDYLNLIETAGRCIREDKRSAIAKHKPRLLARLDIKPR